MTIPARFAGIDIGSQKHAVAIVDERGTVLLKAKMVTEDKDGYDKLFEYLGDPSDLLITMESTGHYWFNLYAALVDRQYPVAVVNPLRTSRFGGEDLVRAKTDKVDAVTIARFCAQKRPRVLSPASQDDQELRTYVRFRERTVQDLTDRVRQLHRQLDFCFPELTNYIKKLDSDRALKLLERYPTAEALAAAKPGNLGRVVYDGRHRIGKDLAKQVIDAARNSVGSKNGPGHEFAIACICRDIREFKQRIKLIEASIEALLELHEVGTLLVSIPGIGTLTAASIIAEAGDPARFRNAAAFCAYTGLTPRPNLSGMQTHKSFGISRIGNRRLRHALYMPTLVAVRCNPWLKRFYDRLLAKGKPKMVAITACMHKLLRAVYSVAKNRKPFVPHLPQESAAT